MFIRNHVYAIVAHGQRWATVGQQGVGALIFMFLLQNLPSPP